MVPAGNKARRLSLVNQTTKKIHHHHHQHHQNFQLIRLSNIRLDFSSHLALKWIFNALQKTRQSYRRKEDILRSTSEKILVLSELMSVNNQLLMFPFFELFYLILKYLRIFNFFKVKYYHVLLIWERLSL